MIWTYICSKKKAIPYSNSDWRFLFTILLINNMLDFLAIDKV